MRQKSYEQTASADGAAMMVVRGNVLVFFLGSDDFPNEPKAAPARDLHISVEASGRGFKTIQTFALSAITEAHESVEGGKARGRVVVTP